MTDHLLYTQFIPHFLKIHIFLGYKIKLSQKKKKIGICSSLRGGGRPLNRVSISFGVTKSVNGQFNPPRDCPGPEERIRVAFRGLQVLTRNKVGAGIQAERKHASTPAGRITPAKNAHTCDAQQHSDISSSPVRGLRWGLVFSVHATQVHKKGSLLQD